MTNEPYAAGIVLYEPDLNRLKDNLTAITPQVRYVYCFNNGLGDDAEAADALLATYDNVIVIGDGRNIGIASALNALVNQAHDDGMTWILTLDQDSVASAGMITAMSTLVKADKVAIICPQVEDERRKNEQHPQTTATAEDVDFCITSGSFMNVSATLAIGGFDDRLFIDLVDNEICHRAKSLGYRIIRNNSVVLNHELGKLTPSKHEVFWLKLGTILHCETLKKLSYRREVSPMRLYYATRNMMYLNRKYQRNSVPAWSTKQLIHNSLASILRDEHRITLIKAVLKGIRDGKTL